METPFYNALEQCQQFEQYTVGGGKNRRIPHLLPGIITTKCRVWNGQNGNLVI
jgi:hypothetical protein